MMNVANLRADVPRYDLPDLEPAWFDALEVMIGLDELVVPCAMNIGLRRVLFQVIRAMKAKRVLDIGTYVGTSALNFALAVDVGGAVTTVDIRDANADEGYWLHAGRGRTPRRMMEQAGIADRVEFINMDSLDYMRRTRCTFDFISLDGWHEKHAVYQEIPLALSLLNPGGLVFLDDVQLGPPPSGIDTIDGPRRALEQYTQEDASFRVVYLRNGLEDEAITGAFLVKGAT